MNNGKTENKEGLEKESKEEKKRYYNTYAGGEKPLLKFEV